MSRKSDAGPEPSSSSEATTSNEPPPSFQDAINTKQPDFKTKFACMTLNRRDRIRLLNFPQPEALAVQEVIKSVWRLGIQLVRPYGQSCEIKVNGNPWQHDSAGNDDSRRLVLRMFERLFDMGWVHQAAIDITGKVTSKDSLIFRKQDPPPPSCEWIAISFDRSDKLKIVGAVSNDLKDEIVKTFGLRIQRKESTGDRLKIKFRGTPWMPNGEETVETSLMLLTLLEILEHCGFTVYASIDMASDEERETDVLICQRQKGWTPGAPIWHR